MTALREGLRILGRLNMLSTRIPLATYRLQSTRISHSTTRPKSLTNLRNGHHEIYDPLLTSPPRQRTVTTLPIPTDLMPIGYGEDFDLF